MGGETVWQHCDSNDDIPRQLYHRFPFFFFFFFNWLKQTFIQKKKKAAFMSYHEDMKLLQEGSVKRFSELAPFIHQGILMAATCIE